MPLPRHFQFDAAKIIIIDCASRMFSHFFFDFFSGCSTAAQAAKNLARAMLFYLLYLIASAAELLYDAVFANQMASAKDEHGWRLIHSVKHLG